MGVAVLRKMIVAGPLTRMWLTAWDRAGHVGRSCPVCAKPMAEVPGQNGGPPLDVCRRCYLVWFDPKEYDLLPARPLPAPEPEMPQEAREILALERVRALREEAEEQWGAAEPEEWWKYVPGLLGMPVEYGDQAVRVTPWATWIVSALLIAAGVAALTDLPRAVAAFGLIPAELWREGGVTLLTSFFIHGGVLHLAGNLYFLILFGDNVEEYLGTTRYLLLLLAAVVTGGLAHVALDPRSAVPVIGASGGISGIIAFYVLRFPQARLGIMLRPLFLFRWIRLRAYAFGFLWVLLQLAGAWQQVAGTGTISALAHLGGAAAGLAFWLAWRGK
ncbi:MAG TPA: rhomboid family intramembrane serine protease [bacterium]|nr:rhomboid family intramembrane serine protease [bacterium]